MATALKLPTECVAVYLAGTAEVNGLYFPSGNSYAGFPMFRKASTNIGLVLFDDKKLYISDCGNEFLPSGPDHLDYYISATTFRSAEDQMDRFEVGEDGSAPAPTLKFVTDESSKLLSSALRTRASRLVAEGDSAGGILHFESITRLPGTIISDFLTLARLYLETENKPYAWSTLVRLAHNRDLLFDGDCPRYTKHSRIETSSLLSRSIEHPLSTSKIVSILTDKNLFAFLEFLIPLCEEIRNRMELKDFNPRNFDDESIDSLIAVSNERKDFQTSGGIELAINLRELYRNIDIYTFDQRDSTINRMKIFSLTDLFRQYASDGKLDTRGRDGTFKNFWEANVRNNEPDIDPREQEARIKDLDPSKEMKCSVIKAINEGKEEEDTQKFFTRRSELLAQAPEHIFTLEDIQKCDCNNTELKLISIHGVVFDVTHNLEKYAPDGEYFFFPGHDISYPLAVSSLSGDHVDEFYRLERPDHLKRVYGWMEYFVNKYKIVGKLKEYDSESEWPSPPEGEEEAEMQCSIM